VRFLIALISVVRESRIDLMHAHLLGSSVYCLLAGAITGTPVIATFHGSVDIDPQARFFHMKRLLLGRAASIVAVSKPLEGYLARALRLPSNHVVVIPNGIDCQKFESARSLGLRSRLGIPGAATLVGSLGNIRPAKAYETGLLAFRRALDRGLDAHWLIAGDGSRRGAMLDQLKRMAVELGIDERVHFLGYVAAPENFLAELDVFFLCSRSEGHPLALTQALAGGIPFVSTRCGVESVLGGEAYGWFADIDRPDELGDTLLACASSNSIASERARLAQQFVRGAFDNRVMFDTYEQQYQRVLRHTTSKIGA
jgi:glycosyltransferase involved in cell wall biosynthesis